MATRGEATKAPVAPAIRRVPSHVEPEIAEARRTQKERLAKLKEFGSVDVGSGDQRKKRLNYLMAQSKAPRLRQGTRAGGGAAARLNRTLPGRAVDATVLLVDKRPSIHRVEGEVAKPAGELFLQTENNYTNRELSPCQPRPPRTRPLRQRYIQHSFVNNPSRVVRADGAH